MGSLLDWPPMGCISGSLTACPHHPTAASPQPKEPTVTDLTPEPINALDVLGRAAGE